MVICERGSYPYRLSVWRGWPLMGMGNGYVMSVCLAACLLAGWPDAWSVVRADGRSRLGFSPIVLKIRCS